MLRPHSLPLVASLTLGVLLQPRCSGNDEDAADTAADRLEGRRNGSRDCRVRHRRLLGSMLAGTLLLGACSPGFTDDERAHVTGVCLTAAPLHPCHALVQVLEEKGCTPEEAEGIVIGLGKGESLSSMNGKYPYGG